MLITNPRRFLELASAGLCGNTPQVWLSLEEFVKSDAKYAFVGTTVPGDNFRIYHCTKRLARQTWKAGVFAMKVPSRRHQFAFPRFQGEVCLSRLEMRWVRSSTALGEAKRSGKIWELRGIRVRTLLREWLLEDYEMLLELEDLYPNSIIEFTQMGFECGIYGRNTLIWEVRHY